MSRIFLAAFLTGGAVCVGQMSPIDRYMNTKDIADVAAAAPGRTPGQIRGILPARQSQRFAEYVSSKSTAVDIVSLRQQVERLRLNKLVGSSPGASGTTSLLSKVSVPGILGFATEYGGILQTNAGNVSTLRGNLLGLTQMAFGAEQFPYCPEIDEKNCQSAGRWLRRFSGSLSFGSVRGVTAAGSASAGSTPPVPVNLFGSEFRMNSWGARFDLTANDPEDPKFVPAWRKAIQTLRGSKEALDLTKAVDEVFVTVPDLYDKWAEETAAVLQDAESSEFKSRLERQLDILVERMAVADAAFGARIAALRRSFLNYASVRDDLLKQIQSHRASLEYTNQHPQNQLNMSNFRMIYSHQPTKSPTLVTANAGFTWYNRVPGAIQAGKLRDVQLAGQLDRRLGEIAGFGNAVATFGAYYQWMKEDAVITIGPGNVAPGSGIVLPTVAAQLLGTKGHIGVVQGKLTIPINGAVKVPVSVTWSNRTELIKESDLRGQVGLTLDLDSLFKK